MDSRGSILSNVKRTLYVPLGYRDDLGTVTMKVTFLRVETEITEELLPVVNFF